MRTELRAMLTLAWPVIVAEMGWMVMGIVDTIMVGPLGPAAIGAVGAGSILYMALMMVGFGTLFALDTFVAQSYGAGRIDECHRWLFAGSQLAVVMTVVLSALAVGGLWLLPAFEFHPEVLGQIEPYMTHLVWSTPALMAYVVFRRYLQAMDAVRPVMVALIVANLVNIATNWVLIFGRLGLPALGVVGAAYATVVSRTALALFLFLVILHREHRRPSGLHDVPFVVDLPRMWAIVRLGVPAAAQIVLEVGVFAAVSALAGRITPLAAAAHQIVLNIAGFFFMVPLGLGTAAAVRVGQAIGRRDHEGARRAGWAALGLSLGCAMTFATLYVTVPGLLLGLFTTDKSVLAVGATLLLLCALFQPFDGFQTVATGALRGVGDTRTPMYANLVGHWLIGLPVGYLLCFGRGWGVVGLWTGLTVGLALIGAFLLVVWARRAA
jgi:MATE family, multidrug efflux pump